MPNIITITLGVTLASCVAAFGQPASGPPTSLATKQAPPEAAQTRPTDVKTTDAQDKGLPERNARGPETDHPAIGPATTQGLAQDSIARSNRR